MQLFDEVRLGLIVKVLKHILKGISKQEEGEKTHFWFGGHKFVWVAVTLYL